MSTEEENNDENQLVTIRVPKVLLKAIDEKLVQAGSNRAETVREILEVKVHEAGVKVQSPVNFDNLKEQRYKLLKKEEDLCKLLCDVQIRGKYGGVRRPAYEILVEFAVTLGTNRELTLNINEVLEKLMCYETTPDDGFNDSLLESFVEFIEIVVKRQQVEAEIIV